MLAASEKEYMGLAKELNLGADDDDELDPDMAELHKELKK